MCKCCNAIKQFGLSGVKNNERNCLSRMGRGSCQLCSRRSAITICFKVEPFQERLSLNCNTYKYMDSAKVFIYLQAGSPLQSAGLSRLLVVFNMQLQSYA
jgi:hypothetical protein